MAVGNHHQMVFVKKLMSCLLSFLHKVNYRVIVGDVYFLKKQDKCY